MAIDREILGDWLVAVNWVIFAFVFLVQATYIGNLALAALQMRKHTRLAEAREFVSMEAADYVPPVSVIVPAYNEELTIAESVRSYFHMEYPKLEIVVVNDGSKDGTLETLKAAYDLVPIDQVYSKRIQTKPVNQVYHSLTHPDLIVVDKQNGGKADAINAGINICRSPLFCVVDADSILEEQALLQIVHPFIEEPEDVVAVGGIVRIANGSKVEKGRVGDVRLPTNYWATMQVLEYLRAFLIGRSAWSRLNGLLIIAGAFGVFRTNAVKEAGGYLTDTVGEDMELTVRLHRLSREQGKRWKVLFAPDPVCWTQAPEDLATLSKQRNRWHRGLSESLWRHKRMLFNPRYGRIGLLSMPYFVFVEWLGPIVELLGWIIVPLSYALGFLNVEFALAFMGVSLLYGQVVSVGALLLEERSYRKYQRFSDLLVLFRIALTESLFYRPLNSWWKLKALLQMGSKKHVWGEMKRKSF